MDDNDISTARRQLFRAAGAGTAGLLLAPGVVAQTFVPPSVVDTGRVEQGKVVFPTWRAPADTPSAPTPAPLPPEQRVGFAVVGLGRLALEEILPAFGAASKGRCVALVSGRPEKMRLVAAQYGIEPAACYSYEAFDSIAANPAVQVVYIVLPNAMHRLYCERAARAGKHVLTEKPMSISSKDGQAMVTACATAKVHLMVAYRIQYEAYNRRTMQMVRSGRYGRLLAIHAVNTQTVAEDGAQQWRHKRAMAGGGSLYDIGLYCLNTARFMTGEEPVEIYANSYSPPGDPRFAEVEETISFNLRFPSHTIANCLASYGGRDDKYQRFNLETVALDMANAYQYKGQQLAVIGRRDDATSRDQWVLEQKNQFAAEIDHMAECVMTNRRPYTPGEEGVQDQVLMEAIYRSVAEGRPMRLPVLEGKDRFRGPPPV